MLVPDVLNKPFAVALQKRCHTHESLIMTIHNVRGLASRMRVAMKVAKAYQIAGTPEPRYMQNTDSHSDSTIRACAAALTVQ